MLSAPTPPAGTEAVFVRSPDLADLPGVSHAFFTRQGGVSTGIYASLNGGTGSNDDPEAVRVNRARMAGVLGVEPGRFLSLHQVHSAECVTVTAPWPDGGRPKADGLATRVPGLALVVGAADCGPVLFADREAGVIGACHSGWKGALGGILENTIAAMEELGATRRGIVAALGPTIGRDAYEVGAEFVERFAAADADATAFFRLGASEDRSLFDLPAYVLGRLERAGIGRAVDLGLCTYSDPERFFSYRRTTHRGEPDYGRLLAGIALDPGKQ